MTHTPITSMHIRQAKGQRKLAMVTAYDYPSALLADAAHMDILLVGDSLGMAVLGHKDTLGVHMEHMLHHCRAVSAAQTRALVVGDMPFRSYEANPELALHNAGRLVAEGGVRAIKLEGRRCAHVRALVEAGIPVMGHVGLTPQHTATLGGFKVQGRTAHTALHIIQNAQALEEAGCFALVLECIPTQVAAYITKNIGIPTIGIGAGAMCDGQVLVFHDMLGFNTGTMPRFVKHYAHLGEHITAAMQQYIHDVRTGGFPGTEHSYTLDAQEEHLLHTLLEKKQADDMD